MSSTFFKAIEHDPRIGTTHIGIYAALREQWWQRQCPVPLRAFSHEIMKLAKVAGRATYQRCINDLHDFGYLRYEPSFYAKQASAIYLKLENAGG